MYSKAQQCDHSNYSSLRRHLVANHGIGSIQIIHFTYAIISNNKHTQILSIVFANKFKSQVVSTECFKLYFFGGCEARMASCLTCGPWESQLQEWWNLEECRTLAQVHVKGATKKNAEPHIKTFKTSQNAFECWMSVDLTILHLILGSDLLARIKSARTNSSIYSGWNRSNN